ncbi:MAG: AMP-binding protein [Litoreibacter sp.]|nr:AMP-binding protein [Litoreibacter sp.]
MQTSLVLMAAMGEHAITGQPVRWVHDLIAGKPEQAMAIIEDSGAAFTYGQLDTMTRTLSETLTNHGVRPGDRIMLVSENCATYAAAILAASRLKAWISPVNARQTTAEIDAIRDHSGARCMIFTPEASAASRTHAERLGAIKLGRIDSGAIMVTPVQDAIPEPVEGAPTDRVAALLYTTGTTSTPKGVMLTHANLCWNARVSAKLRGMTPNDTVLGVLPGTHVFGFSSSFLSSLYAGSCIRFISRFSPDAVLDAFAEGASIMSGVPQMYAHILRHLGETGRAYTAPRLHYISAGGAPLDPDWKTRIEAIFGLPLNNGYGLTETSPSVAATRADNPVSDLSCGPPLEDVALEIANPDADGIGELLIRSPGVLKGYYRDPDLTAQTLEPDGTFHSGDLAHIDENGNLHLVGRLKELIIRSGFNVYPPEIEAMLTRHDKVSLAAVVGRPVPGDEEVIAFTLTDGAVCEAELHAFLRDRLAPYKLPRHIVIANELPTAATGKILKHKLVSHFAKALAERDTKQETGP